MMYRNFMLMVGIFSAELLFSSNGDGPVGPRSAALGHASVCLSDVWCARNNQGALGFVTRAEAGTFYENRFLVKELFQQGIAAVLPVKKSAFALSYTSLGYTLYRETCTSIGYGLALHKTVSFGVGLDYLTTRIGDIYGKSSTVSGEVGLLVKLTRRLTMGVHLYNPVRARITTYNQETIPVIFKAGLLYRFSEQVFVTAEAEKTSLQKLNIKGGLEYMPAKTFYIRAGAASYPAQVAFGVGMNYHGLKIDLSSMYHSVLGFSPQVGLGYTFGKEKHSAPVQVPSP